MESKYAHKKGNRAKRNAYVLRDGKKCTLKDQNWDFDEEGDWG